MIDQVTIIAELTERAVRISKTTHHDVFAEWIPHVNWFVMEFYSYGWNVRADHQHERICIEFKLEDKCEEEIQQARTLLDKYEGGTL